MAEIPELALELLKRIDLPLKEREMLQLGLEELVESHLAEAELLERIMFAVVKLVTEDHKLLKEMTSLAKQDWRDLLMQAGFATDLESHKIWSREEYGL